MTFKKRDFCRRIIKLAGSSMILLFSFLLLQQESFSAFYKYVDENGKIHYVDSKTKIPKKYRDDLKVYEEKYDHLSEEKREEKIREDRRQAEALRKKQEAHLEELRRQEKIDQERRLEKQREEELAKIRREKQLAREEYLRSLQTRVEIVGYGQALVPCTLVYNDREIETKLLLDTGCTITTIHDDIAEKLHLKTKMRGKVETAGGSSIRVKYGKLSHIQVGPHKIDNLYVGVIEYKGRESQMKGLLGMNFLAGHEYKIDYANQVIRWAP